MARPCRAFVCTGCQSTTQLTAIGGTSPFMALTRQGNQIDWIETRLNRLEDSAYRAGIGGASGLPLAAQGS